MAGVRVGLKLAPQFKTVDEVRAIWRIADEAGFDHCWNFDHFASIRENTTGDIFEAWTLLGAMAQATERAERVATAVLHPPATIRRRGRLAQSVRAPL